MKVPEIGVDPGGTLELPFLLHNDTDQPQTINLSVDLPSGWTEKAAATQYSVRPQDVYPVWFVLTAPTGNGGNWQQITWQAESRGQTVGSVIVKILLNAEDSRAGWGAGSISIR
jgi:hypothetical protein